MKIDAVGYGLNQTGSIKEKSHPAPPAPPAKPTSPPPPGQAPDKQPGVIRLLQEGHFKGVADVRLRINFDEQLTSLNQQAIQKAVGEKLDGITQAVADKLPDVLAKVTSAEEANKAVAAFNQAMTNAKNRLGTAPNPSPDDLVKALQTAFDGLAASLSDLTPPPATTPPSTEEPPASPLDTLRTAFTSALDGLRQTLAQPPSVLPELSSPKGHGHAYDKFLAIYNAMKAPPAQTPPPPDQTPVDTTA